MAASSGKQQKAMQRISWMKTYLGLLFLTFAAYALTKIEFCLFATGPQGDNPLYLASTLREKKIFDSDIKVVCFIFFLL